MDSREADAAVDAFSVGMWAKRELLLSGVLSARQSGHVKSSLTQDIRKLCDVLVPTYLVPLVSRRAHEAASRLGVDLRATGWHQQLAFDKGRVVFHLDHLETVMDIRTAFLDAPDQAAARDLLADRLAVAWILKEENAVLDRNGLRIHRPDGRQSYAESGIELLDA